MLKPVITEKSLKAVENFNEYTFEVEKTTDKYGLKKLIEETFKVSVKRVRTKINRAKSKKAGKKGLAVKSNDKKQVIVRLDKKDKISLFEIKKGGK